MQQESNENRLDKGLKDRIRELKAMKAVADKKQRLNSFKSQSNGDGNEDPANNSRSIYGPGGSDNSALQSSNPKQNPHHYYAPPVQRKPEDSVYYHPTFNPHGTPPPGHPPMYKQTITQPLSESSMYHTQRPPHSEFHHPHGVSPAQSAPVMGGQMGVPLPPPRPQFSPVMGGQMGVPLPPRPPNAPMMGGQMGIPLPPPRSKFNDSSGSSHISKQNQYQPPVAQIHAADPSKCVPPPNYVVQGVPYGVGKSVGSSGQTNRIRADEEGEEIDPLDPGGAGYRKRFENAAKSRKEKKLQDENHLKEEADQQELLEQQQILMRAEKLRAEMQSQQRQQLHSVELKQEVILEDVDDNEDEEDIRETSERIVIEKRAHMLRASMEASSNKRSGLNEQNTSPSADRIDSNQASSQLKQPMLTKEELMKRRHILHSENEHKVSAPVGPSGPPSMLHSHDQQPGFLLASVPGPTMGNHPNPGRTVGPSYPLRSTSSVDVGPSIGPALSVPKLCVDSGNIPVENSNASTGDDGSSRSVNATDKINNVKSVPHPKNLTMLNGPRLVKADSAVVSFMPASLRVKRQKKPPNETTIDSQAAKRVKTQTSAGSELSAAYEGTGVVGPKVSDVKNESSGPVDDAYTKFMSEINAIGNF